MRWIFVYFVIMSLSNILLIKENQVSSYKSPNKLDIVSKLYYTSQSNNKNKIISVDNKIPQVGIDLIKKFEGFKSESYTDPYTGELPITIGWGFTRRKDGTKFEKGDTMTHYEANELLNYKIEQHFLPSLEKIPYWNEMSSGKKGALLSFAYNLGANFYGSDGFNTITNHLKNKEWNLVADALYLYRNPGSSVEKGLARRRLAEGKAWKND